ncbi:MAG: aerotolerance regulator [Clostridium butyricum]|nr:aerotolerance regulator [Clostridium butyricum]
MSITNLWPLGLLSIIPIVILLYILKRKYKEKEIPSSLLWKEAYKNTQANTPWEKLKVNIMMIIQIIIFLILILALMNPFLNFGGKQYTNLIVAIDNTASMSTLYEYDKSRLDEAKELSKEYIKSINYNTNNFIIEYDGNSNFQTKNSIDDITQGYGSGDISEILSYIRSLGDGLGEYELLLISDKDIDLGDINGKAISLANSGQNAAITNMSHKFVDDKIQIIATIANTGEGDYNGDFSLYNESQLLEVKTIELPKGESITLNYTLENYEGQYIKGELSKKDLISEDNIYYDVIKKLRSKKVLLVTDKNVFLEKGLNGIENIELYKTNDVANITDDYYDLYVFDNVMPKSMPFSGNILFINPESNEFFNVEDKNELSEVTGVKDTLSKYTANMKFIVSSYKNIVMPYYGHPLLKINDDNAGFIGESNGRKIAALGFDIHNSDVALKKEFPILIYELGEQLIESGVLYKNNYKGGDDILINGTSQAENIQITLPNRKIKDIDPGTTYNNITELGIYKVSEKQATGEALEELFSINFPSDSESDLSNENLIETSNIQSESKVLKKGLSIVPFILLLALIGLIIEYVLYLRGN